MSGIDARTDPTMLRCTSSCASFSDNIYQVNSSCVAGCPAATPFFDSSFVCRSSCIGHASEKFISNSVEMMCQSACSSGFYWMDDSTGFLYCLSSCGGSNKSAILSSIDTSLSRCAPRCVDISQETPYFNGSACVSSCPDSSAYYTSDGICVSRCYDQKVEKFLPPSLDKNCVSDCESGSYSRDNDSGFLICTS